MSSTMSRGFGMLLQISRTIYSASLHRMRYANAAQRRDQHGGLPVAVRRLVEQTLAPLRAATQPRHVRLGPGLVDEDQAIRIKQQDQIVPQRTPLGDIGAVLLSGMDRLFL